MTQTMQAVFYRRHGGPDVLEQGQIERPVAGPGQVLVRLVAAGVSPLDWKLRQGLLSEFFSPAFPKIPGRDGGGHVVACGPGATGFSPGEAVVVMAPPAGAAGTAAGFIAADANLTVKVPAGLALEPATALVNAGLSALVAVRTAGVVAGERVLVQSGAGAVGGLIVQLCAHLGAEVTATCRSANADYVRSLGAVRAVAYDAPQPTDLPPQDVVFDLMGGAVHTACYPLLVRGGRLVWLTAAPLIDQGAEWGVTVTRALIRDDANLVAEVLRLAEVGVLRPQIAARLPLSAAAEAHRRLQHGEVTRGRLILFMDEAG